MPKRKLATIRTIAEIKPIENADAIEHVRVDGWWVVCKKGDFSVGQDVLYFEVDSWIPTELAPFLSRGKEPKEYEGVKGERLRTIKLRGALSQGLIMFNFAGYTTDEDLDTLLNIKKWERPISPQLRGLAKGNFPAFLRKTSQERLQNIPEVFDDLDAEYEVSLKADGSSISVFCNLGEVGVCSRNLELKLEDNDNNSFIQAAKSSGWLDKIKHFYEQTGRSIALQGEMCGPGIQSNRSKLDKIKLFLFDIWDIDNQVYFQPHSRRLLTEFLNLQHVPIHEMPTSLRKLGYPTMDELLQYVQNEANIWNWPNPIEGLVFKSVDSQFSFKVINNKYLLKHSD